MHTTSLSFSVWKRAIGLILLWAVTVGTAVVMLVEVQAEEAAVQNTTDQSTTVEDASVEEASLNLPMPRIKPPESGPVTVAGLEWRTDYQQAYEAAKQAKRMLLVNFVETLSDDDELGPAQVSLEKTITADEKLQTKLRDVVLVRLPLDAEISVDGKTTRLISHAAFQHLSGKPGIAMLDLAHQEKPFYGKVVSAYPFTTGKYYRWQNDYLAVMLDLPPGTITQRTMIWAVRIHPEHPASTTGAFDPDLAQATAQQSQYQADIGVQGHHRWNTRFHQIRSQVRAQKATEVVAESWPGQNMIDSCLDCVASWRHSSGHWGAVRGRHRLYGYDIRRGRNGIWYGTGIFAD